MNCKCKVYIGKLKCKASAHAIQTRSFLNRLIHLLSSQCDVFIPQFAVEGMQMKIVQNKVNMFCTKINVKLEIKHE